ERRREKKGKSVTQRTQRSREFAERREEERPPGQATAPVVRRLLEDCLPPNGRGGGTGDGEQRARATRRAEGWRERVPGRTLNENECRGKELAENLLVNQGFVAAQEIVKTELSGEQKEADATKKSKDRPLQKTRKRRPPRKAGPIKVMIRASG